MRKIHIRRRNNDTKETAIIQDAIRKLSVPGFRCILRFLHYCLPLWLPVEKKDV